MGHSSVLEPGCVSLKGSSKFCLVSVLDSLVLGGQDIMGVLFRESFLGLERLDRGVMVVLMKVLVHDGDNLLVLVWANVLFSHGRAKILVDGGFVSSVLGQERFGGLLCFLHDGDDLSWCKEVVVFCYEK